MRAHNAASRAGRAIGSRACPSHSKPATGQASQISTALCCGTLHSACDFSTHGSGAPHAPVLSSWKHSCRRIAFMGAHREEWTITSTHASAHGRPGDPPLRPESLSERSRKTIF